MEDFNASMQVLNKAIFANKDFYATRINFGFRYV